MSDVQIHATHGLDNMRDFTRIEIKINAFIWLPSDKALKLLHLLDEVRALIEEGEGEPENLHRSV